MLVEALEPRDSAGSGEPGEPGVPGSLRRTGRIDARTMPVVDRFESALDRTPTLEGYVFDGSWAEAARLLRTHGVTVTPLERAMTGSVQVFMIDSVHTAATPFQGNREVSVTGAWMESTRLLPAGTFLVRVATPRDLLAMQLLEPESDDGLLTWNAFDAALGRGKEAPVARLTAPPRLYSPGRSGASRR